MHKLLQVFKKRGFIMGFKALAILGAVLFTHNFALADAQFSQSDSSHLITGGVLVSNSLPGAGGCGCYSFTADRTTVINAASFYIGVTLGSHSYPIRATLELDDVTGTAQTVELESHDISTSTPLLDTTTNVTSSSVYPDGLHVTAGDTIHVALAIPSGDTINSYGDVSDNPYFVLGSDGDTTINTLTHFISTTPVASSTVATSTTVGADVYINSSDFPTAGRLHILFSQDNAFVCLNSTFIYEILSSCGGDNAPQQPFSVDFDDPTSGLLAGEYNLSTTTLFKGVGAWTATMDIQQVSAPWYYLGLVNYYTTVVEKVVHFTVATSSAADIIRNEANQNFAAVASSSRNSLASVLASTTIQIKDACNPVFNSNFNVGDCLTLLVYPGQQALEDDLTILKETPPWGYAFRVIDILTATTSSTTLPTISYSFASTSPMAAVGDIHFDPFGEIAQSGALVNSMQSDRGDGATVWTIMMPVVNIFVYLVLAFMIIHDLTGVHNGEHPRDNSKGRKRGLIGRKK